MRHIAVRISSVFSFLLILSGTGYAQVVAIDKVVGVVGEEVVLYSEVQGQILELIQNKIPVEDETECILFENYLYNGLLLHQAKLDSIEPNVEQIEAELTSRMSYYRNLLNQYGQTFESAYGKSELEWKEEIREVMMKRNQIEQMQAKITENVTITPREVKAYFEKIPKDSLPRINSKVEYSELIIYPEVSEEAEQIEISRLKRWREQILAGDETFDFLAKIYSEDEGSAEKGGNFDCVSKGMFVPEFDAVALGLKPGEISLPFRTQYGWHIVKIEDRRGTTYCGRHILRIPKMGETQMSAAKDSINKIAERINTGEISFCDATKAYSQDEDTRGACGMIVNPRDGSTMWDVSALDRDVAILLNTLSAGEVSSPFVFDTQDRKKAFKIVMLKKRTPPHIANLNDDYQLIQTAALNDKSQKVIDKWINDRITISHIWIAPDYTGCNFTHQWLKNTASK